MSSLSPLNNKPSFLAILNLLCPHYLWTYGFLDLLPFIPSEFSYSDWFYHVPNLWIIFSHSFNLFRKFYLVNALPLEHPRQFKVFRNSNHSIADLQKLWRGSCWHSKKTNSQTTFQPVWTMSNLLAFTKDKSQTSWRPVFTHLRGTNKRLGLYWSSEADRKLRLPLKRPKQA